VQDALRGAEIVVLLLPDTAATQNTLNAQTLGLLARGAFVINPGRGPLIDDASLLAALETHIASETRPDTAAHMIADNIARCERGAPLLHLVDRKVGY